jgi:hypothetical protein
MEHTYEISPFLLKAVAELDGLVAQNRLDTGKSVNTDLVSDLLSEVNELEQLVRASDDATTDAAVVDKFDRVRRHINAL